jgi:hypothetical protein
MSTFGGASQRQSGKSNHLFRQPLGVSASVSSTGTDYQYVNFSWQNLTKQSTSTSSFGFVQFLWDTAVYTSYETTSTNMNVTLSPAGANVVTNWQLQGINNTGVITARTPSISLVFPPYIPRFEPYGWNNYGFPFTQAGTAYNGGGQTVAIYNSMSGSVIYNIKKNGAAYLYNVTMPYTLTHSGSNGVLATYAFEAVGSAGGTSSGTWQISPRASSSYYVSAANEPPNGDQQANMWIQNSSYAQYAGPYWIAEVAGRLEGTCVSCGGCVQTLMTLFSYGYSSQATNVVYISTYYYRGDGASSSYAQFADMNYLVKDYYGNGDASTPAYYGYFGNYNLQNNC